MKQILVQHGASRVCKEEVLKAQNVAHIEIEELLNAKEGLAHTLAQECWNVLKPGG